MGGVVEAYGSNCASTTRPFGNPIAIVQSPGRCFLIAECTYGGGAFVSGAGGIGINYDSWAQWWHRGYTISNFAFVDGHVKGVRIGLRYANNSLGVYTAKSTDDALIPDGRY